MPRGRRRQFDPEEVLEAAMEVFWTRGYEDTTLDEVMELGAIGRQSLYDSFGNKRQLFLSALRAYGERMIEQYRVHLNEAESPVGALIDLMRALLAPDHPGAGRGCLMVNTGIESVDEEVRPLVRDHFAALRGILEQGFERAKREGELPTDFHAEHEASAWSTSLLGLALLARFEGLDDTIVQTVDRLTGQLEATHASCRPR